MNLRITKKVNGKLVVNMTIFSIYLDDYLENTPAIAIMSITRFILSNNTIGEWSYTDDNSQEINLTLEKIDV